DDQHPDHQFGIDRRSTDLAVERLQLRTKASEYPCHDRIDPTQKMVPRNATFEVEEIEQLSLIDSLTTHHDPPPSPTTSRRRNHDSPTITSAFFNAIDPKRNRTATIERKAASAHRSCLRRSICVRARKPGDCTVAGRYRHPRLELEEFTG